MTKQLSKGGVIALSCLLIFAITMLILLNVVFVIKEVKANLLKEPLTLTNEEIVEQVKDSDVKIEGHSVFFYNRSKMVARIEKAIPKIKIINLEVQFPNILRINCEERMPIFALALCNSTYSYAIVDEEFKVISTANSTTNYLPLNFQIGETLDDYLFNDLRGGDFATISEISELKTFFYTLKEYSITETVLKEHFTSITVYYSANENGKDLSLNFYSNQGYRIIMKNIAQINENRISVFASIISNGGSELSGDQIV